MNGWGIISKAMAERTSRRSATPTAPPFALEESNGSSSSLPNYNAVLEQDHVARENAAKVRNRNLMGSLAFAGASVGRFFGIHDDETEWNRAGTLPPNGRALRYDLVSQQESVPVVTPPGTPSPYNTPDEAMRWRGRIKNTLKKIHRKDPSREEVMKSLPSFWPVVTVLIAMIEVALLIATIITGGLAPIRFTPEVDVSTVVDFDNEQISVSRKIIPNFFIGTTKAALVHTGAMYTPCMRENVNFQVEVARNRSMEDTLRCCLSNTARQCGMVSQQMCTNFYEGTILGGASRCRAEMNETTTCTGGVVLHPCCIGLLGDCAITTEERCAFQEGVWHPEKVVCSEVGVDCFKDICRFTWVDKTIGQVPSQGMRFFSAMFLYDGIVSLVIVGLFKFYKSWTIERRIGWLRVLCVYILSGIGGFLLTGLFDPTSVSVGGTGGLFGLLAVTVVDLLQGWKWVHKPCIELFKVLTLIIILLLLGTLPYIDNFTQIGGFIFGVLASFIFVPYISIGKWDRVKKLCILSIAVPVLLILFLLGFVFFYNLPDPNFCPKCSYINCIPFTKSFCEDFIFNFLPMIPSST